VQVKVLKIADRVLIQLMFKKTRQTSKQASRQERKKEKTFLIPQLVRKFSTRKSVKQSGKQQ